ncbi:colicin transporter [Bifidobacterium catenulatum]|uniref:colicin transporter n=1 Tax=Bifidobacterium catenulatum TaxID=1686 RepID=UPI00254EE55F|nr:colicin transporter [Bifidobacterium catenulatum]WJD54534.1 colicin transporter [Bifidobacterium catenulatum]WJO86727.1 colicin transporter [Bifidobacterium catenulatum]
MTEKEKAIEDETIELSNEPTEKKTKKPHRRRAIVVTVVVLALLTAGGIAWKTHADRLMAEARADCAAASERLRTATNDWNTLLNGSAADAAKTDRKSVKDAKMLDALSKTMKATIPKTVSCKADSRTGVQEAAKAITANAAWYKTHAKTLSKAVKAVESSKLDKTVDDAQALYDATSGKVQDDKTRASLLDAIKKRDADAIGKAVKTVNESKAAKEKADAEAKAKAEQEAAAAAAAQQQAAQSYSGGSYSYSNNSRNYSYSGGSSSGSTSTPAQSNGGGSSSPGPSGSDLHIVIGGSGTPAQNGPSHGEPNI